MTHRRRKIAKRNVAKRRSINTFVHLNHRAPSHTLAQAIKVIVREVKFD
jgi:hypothetical protein